MTDTWTIGYDYTAGGYPHAPGGPVVAGYTTGSGDVPWTAEMWAAHPDAVRICQDAGATDTTADVLDVESGAATIADVVPWARAAIAHFNAGTRPGQRRPLIYASASLLTPIANALTAGLLVNGEVGFWVAHWGVSEAQAIADVVNAGGNWPIHAFQFANTSQYYDSDIFSDTWLAARSLKPVPPPEPPVPVPPKVAESLTVHYSDGSTQEVKL